MSFLDSLNNSLLGNSSYDEYFRMMRQQSQKMQNPLMAPLVQGVPIEEKPNDDILLLTLEEEDNAA